jgi:hypothetical protein
MSEQDHSKCEHSEVAHGFLELAQELTAVLSRSAQAAGVTPVGAASVCLYSAASILIAGAGMGKKEATDKLIELCKDMQNFVMEQGTETPKP